MGHIGMNRDYGNIIAWALGICVLLCPAWVVAAAPVAAGGEQASAVEAESASKSNPPRLSIDADEYDFGSQWMSALTIRRSAVSSFALRRTAVAR